MSSKGVIPEFKVRPLANPTKEKGSLQGAARVYVNKDALIALTKTLDEGKLCTIKTIGGPSFDEGKPASREASLWLPDQNISANIVMMTKAFQDAAGFRLGDKVRIVAGPSKVEDADEVLVADITNSESTSWLTREDEDGWTWSIKLFLSMLRNQSPLSPKGNQV
jgi:AAA family ATPase